MKPPFKFTPEDFIDERAGTASIEMHGEYEASVANDKLAEYFKDAKRVWFNEVEAGDYKGFYTVLDHKYKEATYQALFTSIKPIKKPCEHVNISKLRILPTKRIHSGYYCKKCGIEMVPTDFEEIP